MLQMQCAFYSTPRRFFKIVYQIKDTKKLIMKIEEALKHLPIRSAHPLNPYSRFLLKEAGRHLKKLLEKKNETIHDD